MPFCHLALRVPFPLPPYWPGKPRSFGEYLLARRLEAGLSRRALAQQLGVTEPVLRGWEKGLSKPPAKRLPAVIGFLGYEPPLPTTSSVGAEIRAARRRAGLTQAELGERLGVHENAVSAWERRATLPCWPNSVALIERFLKEAVRGEEEAEAE